MKRSNGGALLWMLILSILLCWLPVLGPFLAGVAGARRAKSASAAFALALIPAALWGVFLIWLSKQEIRLKDQTLTPGEIAILAPGTSISLLGGVLAGGGRGGARALGVCAFLGSAVWLGLKARDLYAFIRQVAPQEAVYEPQKNKTCPENLIQLYNAAMLYADSWDGTLPPADRWMTAIRDNVPQDEWLHCPEVRNQPEDAYGYAMNSALSSKRLSEITDKAKTPLFYDSSNLKIDAHDAFTSLPKPGRHTGRDNVVYVDGHVENLAPR